jgi:hypothetical protein
MAIIQTPGSIAASIPPTTIGASIGSMAGATATAPTSSPNAQRLALDNILRRELGVSDPNDPKQIADALLSRYRNSTRAQAIDQEARGLPMLASQLVPAASGPAGYSGATAIDLQQSLVDVDDDLEDLKGNNTLKDILPELEGWSDDIHAVMENGVAAARFGIDPNQRDQAFAARRKLGEYAYLARLVGALTPVEEESFRNLAESLDEVSAVILVTLGESLANLGFSGGRYLLQVPFTELQIRRDAVLNALRNLTGSTQQAFSPDSWSRGLDSYRQVFDVLEDAGQSDLRSLMNETQLAQLMDQLIHLAGGGSTDGLRALGATAFSRLNQFQRLIQVTLRSTTVSPPLIAFQDALQLFIDGFTTGGGFRLLRVARPPILFYGLYGYNTLQLADQRLMGLVMARGPYAEALDQFARTGGTLPPAAAGFPLGTRVLLQAVLDKILYCVDRAIDLYCVGDADLGLPEARASAYSFAIDALSINAWPWRVNSRITVQIPPYLVALPVARPGSIHRLLNTFRGLLRPVPNDPHFLQWERHQRNTYNQNVARNAPWRSGLARVPVGLADLLHDELSLQKQMDINVRPIVQQMTKAGNVNAFFLDNLTTGGCLPAVMNRAMGFIDALNPPRRADLLQQPNLPADVDTSMSHIAFGTP